MKKRTVEWVVVRVLRLMSIGGCRRGLGKAEVIGKMELRDPLELLRNETGGHGIHAFAD